MRTLVILLVCLTAVLGTAVMAHAQSTRRPDLNIFGRGLRDPEQSLAVRGNLGGTFYDTLITPEGLEGPLPPDRGWGTFGSAALVYNLNLANVRFDGDFGGFASYYPAQEEAFNWQLFPGASANTGWSWALSEKTQLECRRRAAVSTAL